MINKKVILTQIEIDQLKALIQEAIRSEVSQFKRLEVESSSEEFLTKKEVTELLKISISTLNSWVKEGVIPASRIGTRVRFSKKQIISSMKIIQSYKYKHGRELI